MEVSECSKDSHHPRLERSPNPRPGSLQGYTSTLCFPASLLVSVPSSTCVHTYTRLCSSLSIHVDTLTMSISASYLYLSTCLCCICLTRPHACHGWEMANEEGCVTSDSAESQVEHTVETGLVEQISVSMSGFL
jgi:hypothetical protein